MSAQKTGAQDESNDTAKKVNWWNRIDKRQRIRYLTMAIGILALAPPVAFLAQALGGAGFCGPLCARMGIGTGLISTFGRRPWAIVMLGTWLGITLLAGRWVCSHFCPVGALTEFGAKLWPQKGKIDYAKVIHAPLFRYGFLAAWIMLPAVGLGSICCAYCPQSTITAVFGSLFAADSRAALTTGYRATTVLLYGLVFGIVSRDGRGHCHLICPVGALDSLVNAIGARLPFAGRMRVHQSTCAGCARCAGECPASAITMAPVKAEGARPVAQVDYHRCYQCRACEGTCPTGALYYGRREAA